MSVSEDMVQSSHSKRGLRLLSIDGGGIRGLSTMIILQELMRKIQDRYKFPSLPKPCEVFDLASGIGTGGLMVIMLFRLEMDIDQAIDAYIKLTEHAFSERKWLWWQEGTFKASRLEEAVLKVIMDALGIDKVDAKEVRMLKEDGPKSFVCPVSSRDMIPPTRLRTWNSSGDAGCDCTIVEAARATCAAEIIFKGINIGAESIHPRGLGCNNPTEYILQEATSVFPSEAISCVVSLGTGTVSEMGLDILSHSPNASPRNLVDTLRRIVADCEDRSQNITQQYSNIQDSYFRVNVDQGLQDMLVDEWRRVDDVRKHTEQYLGRQDTADKVERLISHLLIEPTKQSTNRPSTHPVPDGSVSPAQAFERQSDTFQLLDSHDPVPNLKGDTVDRGVAPKTPWKADASEKIVSRRKNILSIDGGGFRGYACLLILYQLMDQLTINPDDPILRPCQVFDLICGTSTGGLIAVLLGRLGLDCVTAMKIYVELGTSLFGTLDEKAWDNIIDWGGLKTEAFETKLASIVEKHTGDKNALLKKQKTSSDKIDHESTDIFITTVEPAGASSTEPYRLRSYTTPSQGIQPTLGDHPWTICEAIRAATASPSFLRPLQIGSQYFQDAGNSGSANPVWDALKEAELRWSKNVQPVIISIGTGVVSLFPVDSDLEEDLSERYYEPVSARVQVGTKAPKSKLWSDEFAKQLIRVTQDTELKHQSATKHFNKRRQANNYIRFNPNAGAGNIDMSDIAQIRMINAITNAWLKMPEAYSLMNQACQALKATLEVSNMPTR